MKTVIRRIKTTLFRWIQPVWKVHVTFYYWGCSGAELDSVTLISLPHSQTWTLSALIAVDCTGVLNKVSTAWMWDQLTVNMQLIYNLYTAFKTPEYINKAQQMSVYFCKKCHFNWHNKTVITYVSIFFSTLTMVLFFPFIFSVTENRHDHEFKSSSFTQNDFPDWR